MIYIYIYTRHKGLDLNVHSFMNRIVKLLGKISMTSLHGACLLIWLICAESLFPHLRNIKLYLYMDDKIKFHGKGMIRHVVFEQIKPHN